MGYDAVARSFHWVTVLLVLVMIPVGLIMTQDLPRPVQDRLFILHKGLGPFVLVVVLLRLAWRLYSPPVPRHADLPALQRRAAATVHGLLYVLLIVMGVSGYVRVVAGGFPIEALNAIGIPPLIGRNEGVAEVAKTIHATAKFALIALILGHVAAAVYHAVILRDGVIRRMWPPFPNRNQ